MSKTKTLSFAHLLGLATRAAKASEDDDQARSAEGPMEDDPGDQQYVKGRKAEDDDDMNPEGSEEDDEDEPKGKKAKGRRADDDEKPDESAEEDDDETPKAVRADRQRCAAIIAYGLANGCAEQAGVLAFESNMGKTAALNVLKAGGSRSTKAPAASLNGRMAQLSHTQVGPEASGGQGQCPPGMSAMAWSIIQAGEKAGQ